MEDSNGNMPSIRDDIQQHNVSSMTVQTSIQTTPSDRIPLVLQLTTQLIHTYTAINHNYYLKRDGKFPRKKTTVKEDKRQYDYQFQQEEEIFNSQYRVRNRILGMGSFGIVVEGTDMTTGQEVAIKIIKKRKGFQEQAQTEIQILQYLHTSPLPGCKYIVQVQNTFIHQGHQCLVFERLGPTLYDLLRKVNFSGLGLKLIRKLTKQIVQALAYMSHPQVNVVHCDLKPENILLVQPTRSQLKIIDFGNACHSNNQMYQYIQSRFYRSPEVILGMQYSSAIDMWSLGCIVAELHTGRPLFGGFDQYDQLRRITNVLGMPPRELIEHANPVYRSKYFDEIVVVEGENRLIDYRIKVRKSPMNTDTQQLAAGVSASDTSTTLEALIGVETGGPGGRRLNKANHTVEDYRLFVDLLRRMLDYNPSTRITPLEALSHPFLNTSDPPIEMREKKSKILRSTPMHDIYSTSTTASSMEIDSLSTSSSMYVDSNMDRVKQRRIGH